MALPAFEGPRAAAPAYQVIDGEPAVPLLDLETVWFQITGTLCNLTCTHCFVDCSPRAGIRNNPAATQPTTAPSALTP